MGNAKKVIENSFSDDEKKSKPSAASKRSLTKFNRKVGPTSTTTKKVIATKKKSAVATSRQLAVKKTASISLRNSKKPLKKRLQQPNTKPKASTSSSSALKKPAVKSKAPS